MDGRIGMPKHPASPTMGADQYDAMRAAVLPKPFGMTVPQIEAMFSNAAPRGAHLHEQGFETRAFRAMLDATETP
ncbi:MAG: hypothetical protein Tp176DCM1853251_43 [Prokaryotic dsDNA virus sp.]|nr:MAG: hypothetical protein Tp176DCM1853251_43 [Prokaryotic dsDNA virus sp.]